MLLASTILLIAATGAAQPAVPHNVYGTVTYAGENTAATGVTVEVRDASNTTHGSDVTDSDGFYDINVGTDTKYWLFVGDWNSSRSFTYTSGASEEIDVTDLPGGPRIQSQSVSTVGTSSADVNATIDCPSNWGSDVTARFRYREQGTSTWTYTANQTVTPPETTFNGSLTGLSSNTTYEVQAEVHFPDTTSPDRGSIDTFTTDVAPPSTLNPVATGIGQTSATLNADIAYNDYENATVEVWFDYRQQGAASWANTSHANTSSTSFSRTVSGLSSGTTYEFRPVLMHDGTTYTGTATTFTTATPSTNGGGYTGTATTFTTATPSTNGDTTNGGGGGIPVTPDPINLSVSLAPGSIAVPVGGVSSGQLVEVRFAESVALQRIRMRPGISITNLSFHVQYLDGARPDDVPRLPDGSEVYAYYGITTSGLAGLVPANLTFRTDTGWIDRLSIAPGDVLLYRYDGAQWQPLDTAPTRTVDGYQWYRAETPGFSTFAIVAVPGVSRAPNIQVRSVAVGDIADGPGLATVNVTLENIGASTGTYDLAVTVDGAEAASRTVRVVAGATTVATFQVDLSAGEHTVAAGGQSTTVTVRGGGILALLRGFLPYLAGILALLILVVGGYAAYTRIAGADEEAWDAGSQQRSAQERRYPVKNVRVVTDNPQTYAGRKIELKHVAVTPDRRRDDGLWWHRIRDDTGEILGLAENRYEKERVTVEAEVERDGDGTYLIF
ncbi:MAG: PGF-pre-PGF domain-containing protein [Candidatus Nanohaloarchaea archaeon]|nr:PGF-pre-PGF domain-containing protein [Candidatus Nanohaloarchaea archaeon]